MLIRRIPSLPTWPTVFREMDDMRRDVSRLFDWFGESGGLHGAGVYPAINVTETPDAIVVRAEVPGIDKEHLDVTVENDTITISGERSTTKESEQANYHRREREWGKFRRSFSLPAHVNAEKVEARCSEGILTVELPKAEAYRPKQIPIQTGA